MPDLTQNLHMQTSSWRYAVLVEKHSVEISQNIVRNEDIPSIFLWKVTTESVRALLVVIIFTRLFFKLDLPAYTRQNFRGTYM